VGARKQGDYPKNLGDFYRRFPGDAACFRYLVETRWPDGFRCPACGSNNAHLMEGRRTWQCRSCRKQTTVTAGTVLHRSKLPLTAWFTAAYLMTSLKPGISALQLQAQLGLSRFETAWFLLHKLRRAMVNPDRSKLAGSVEVDETWVGGKRHPFPGPCLYGACQSPGRPGQHCAGKSPFSQTIRKAVAGSGSLHVRSTAGGGRVYAIGEISAGPDTGSGGPARVEPGGLASDAP
jgi:transposase-like protein